MAELITDTADIKTLSPNFHLQNSSDNVLPYVRDAACLYLHDTISEAFYSELVTQRDTDTVSTANAKVIEYIRISLSYYTMYGASKFINTKVSAAGMMTANPSNGQFTGVKQWEKNETQQEAITKADLFLDKALEIMFSNPSDYPTFTSSKAYQEYSDFLIRDAKEMSQLLQPVTRRTFIALVPWIETAEDKYIRAAIGATLLTGIKTRLLNDTLTTADSIILPMIKKALAYYTIFIGAPALKLDVTDKGIRLVSSKDGISSYSPLDSTFTGAKSYTEWRNNYHSLAESKLGELKNYLESNYEDFPEYESSTAKNNNTPRTTFRDNSGSSSSVMI